MAAAAASSCLALWCAPVFSFHWFRSGGLSVVARFQWVDSPFDFALASHLFSPVAISQWQYWEHTYVQKSAKIINTNRVLFLFVRCSYCGNCSSSLPAICNNGFVASIDDQWKRSSNAAAVAEATLTSRFQFQFQFANQSLALSQSQQHRAK